MESLGEKLPAEILEKIFGYVEVLWLEEKMDYPPISFVRRKPPTIQSSFFAKYRLVSKHWKPVADAFFFREVAVDLNFDTGRNESDSESRYEAKVQPFGKPAGGVMRILLNGGYTSLIRHLHVRFRFYKECTRECYQHKCLAHPLSFWDAWNWEIIISMLKDFRDVLLASQQCLTLSVYLDIGSRLDARSPYPRLSKGRDRLIDSLREFNKHCPDAQIKLYVKYISDGTQDPEDRYIKASLTNELLSATDSLHLELFPLLSAQLFTSFRSMKTLFLHNPELANRPLIPEEFKPIEQGLALMPCLENLHIIGMPICSFPTRLRTLKYSRQLPLPLRFWTNLCRLDKLEELDLSFPGSPSHDCAIDFSLVGNVLFPELRTFKVASDRLSHNVAVFSDCVLENCPSIENLGLSGRVISPGIIRYMPLRMLRSLNLKYRYQQSVQVTWRPNQANEITQFERGSVSWSSIRWLLEENPNMKRLDLSVGSSVAPPTSNELKEIGISNRELNHIRIEYEGTDVSYAASTRATFIDCSWKIMEVSRSGGSFVMKATR